jgi:L,D-transpeptidase YcbB
MGNASLSGDARYGLLTVTPSMTVPSPLGLLASLLCLLVVAVAPAAAGPAADPAEIEALLTGPGDLKAGVRLLDHEELADLYRARDFKPIWDEERAAALRAAVAEAPAQGIDGVAFDVPDAASPAERELLLTDALLRYGRILAAGRVDPQSFESDWLLPRPHFDAVALFDWAAAGDVAAALSDLLPADPAYQRLQAALARYQELAKGAPWPRIAFNDKKLKRGDRADVVVALRQRLADEGFVAPDAGALFDSALETELKRFQAQRGLAVDGTLGKSTLAALNVSAAERVEQIKLNLERWRSVPRHRPATRIEVNVAAATAILYQEDKESLAFRTIIGAADHPTPVLTARIRSVLYNPPWKVPTWIIKHEIRPALRRDPHYLERNGYVYVEHDGDRILQQVPGPKNALGRLKFEMPNPDDIYMHDTPSRTLFLRARRSLSHGCIRVENPRALASRVLEPLPAAEPAAIDAAIDSGETTSIALPHSVPVYTFYWTAFVDDDGTIEFRDDLYGRDRRLAAALATAVDTAATPAAKEVAGRS